MSTPPKNSSASSSYASASSSHASASTADSNIENENQDLRAQNQLLIQRLQALETQQAAHEAQLVQEYPPAPEQPLNAPAEVNLVRNLKIPPFWRENPALWFAQVEAAFALSNITADATQFRHVITQLDSQTLPAISDIILNPPGAGKYLAIKTRIMSSYAETSESKLRKLLRGLDPTNDKPTLLLQRIRNLAEGQVGDALLRTLFLEQLPEYVRGVLVISGDLDLSVLALQADKVMEATKTNVHAIHQPTQQTEVAAISRDTAVSDLINAVAALTKEIKSMKTDRRSRSRSSSRYRSASTENNGGICFYHARYGDDARRCQKPCAKSQKQEGN